LFANYLIGLREGLEAVIVVSILVAYLVKTGRRERLRAVGTGVAIAVIVSVGLFTILTVTSNQLTHTQQEGFGGTLSIVAVGFVTWMIFWMRRTARHLSSDLRHRIDAAVALGTRALVVTALLAVGREGLETSLFVWSAVQATGETTQPIIGAVLGLLTSVVAGYLIYRGALKINLSKFFTWTGGALVLIAGGVLAYGLHDLQEAGTLPGLGALAFDVSRQVPPSSWYGTLLKGTLNFSPATTWLEAVAWLLYVVPVMYLFLRPSSAPRPHASAPAADAAPTHS
jgi:high-affinity iron transporter